MLAPSASRYFGRNSFQSSSPKPSRKTAPEASVTLRSRLRNSERRATRLPERCVVCWRSGMTTTLSVLERCGRERVKLATEGGDVLEGKGMMMSAVGEENENAFMLGIDPTTCAGEAGVTKSIESQTGARGRVFGRG